MPASYVIDTARGLVISTFSGTLTDADLMGQLQAVHADALFRPEYDQLVDATAVSGATVSSATIRMLAQGGRFDCGSRRALVATLDVMYGLWRMYAALNSGRCKLAAFRNRREADDWLAL
jgi:hypothetical protein